ncbi:MAG: ABC transporter substrate-binding protein [Betaproteobacteria bacterium]|nr:ABC transporter substrate-binding protein [Betaproteobacteria bacterium]
MKPIFCRTGAPTAAETSGECHPSLSRRGFLRGASAGVIAATLPPIAGTMFPRSARAAAGDKEVVLSMSGGSFMTNWQTKVIDPFQKLTGIKVRMVSGNVKAHGMQLRANRNNPPFDLFLGDNADFVSLIAAGTFLPLTEASVPNIKDIHPKFKDGWGGYAVGFDYSSVGLAYRTDRIKNPPASWREFVERAAAGEFGKKVYFNNLPSGVRGAEVLLTLSRVFGGDQKNVDAGFAAIKRFKPYVFKYFSSFNDPVVLLTNGEGDIGTGWDGRTYVAHDETGGKVNWINPKEGAASSGPPLGVVKGGNSEGAFALLNYALGVEAQKAFCEAMFYGSPNTKVVYSEALAKRIPALKDVQVFDEKFMAENLAAWIDRWNREIAV